MNQSNGGHRPKGASVGQTATAFYPASLSNNFRHCNAGSPETSPVPLTGASEMKRAANLLDGVLDGDTIASK